MKSIALKKEKQTLEHLNTVTLELNDAKSMIDIMKAEIEKTNTALDQELSSHISTKVNNVWCIKIRTKGSSKRLLSLVRILMHQTLHNKRGLAEIVQFKTFCSNSYKIFSELESIDFYTYLWIL